MLKNIKYIIKRALKLTMEEYWRVLSYKFLKCEKIKLFISTMHENIYKRYN